MSVKQTLPFLWRCRVLGAVKQAVWASWIVSKRPLNSWTCRGQHNRTETKTEKNPGTNGSNLPRDLQDKKKTKKKHATRHKLIQSTIYNPMLSNAITCNSIQHSKKFRQKKWEIRGGSQEPMAAICHGISRPEKIEETEETRNKLHDTHKN